MVVNTAASRPPGCCYVDAGALYVLGMFVVGNVEVGTAAVLNALAMNAGTTTTALWPAYILTGLGQLLSVFGCPTLFRAVDGDVAISGSFVLTVGFWLAGPYLDNMWLLYIWFFMRGVVTTIITTGVQIMTRRVFGQAAGPKLGLNPCLFACAGAVTPLVAYATGDSLTWTCFIYALVAAATAVAMAVYVSVRDSLPVGPLGDSLVQPGLEEGAPFKCEVKGPSSNGNGKHASNGAGKHAPNGNGKRVTGKPLSQGPHSDKASWVFELLKSPKQAAEGDDRIVVCHVLDPPRPGFWRGILMGLYNTDLLLGLILFLSVGGETALAFYVATFVLDTEIIPSSQASLLLSLFWAALVVGRLIAMFGQRDITTQTLFGSLCTVSSLTALAPVALLYGGITNHWEGWEAWVSVVAWALVVGPTQGYVYDISNRICGQSEEASSILIGGLQLGVTFVVVALAAVWDSGAIDAIVVPIFLSSIGGAVLFLSLCLPCVSDQFAQALRRKE